MNREEAKSRDMDVWCMALIDEIYDDFESRTCGNCEFYINNENSIGCPRIDINYNQPTFGCNEFIRKTNE